MIKTLRAKVQRTLIIKQRLKSNIQLHTVNGEIKKKIEINISIRENKSAEIQVVL